MVTVHLLQQVALIAEVRHGMLTKKSNLLGSAALSQSAVITVSNHSNSSFFASATEFKVLRIPKQFTEGAVNSLLFKAAGGTFV